MRMIDAVAGGKGRQLGENADYLEEPKDWASTGQVRCHGGDGSGAELRPREGKRVPPRGGTGRRSRGTRERREGVGENTELFPRRVPNLFLGALPSRSKDRALTKGSDTTVQPESSNQSFEKHLPAPVKRQVVPALPASAVKSRPLSPEKTPLEGKRGNQ